MSSDIHFRFQKPLECVFSFIVYSLNCRNTCCISEKWVWTGIAGRLESARSPRPLTDHCSKKQLAFLLYTDLEGRGRQKHKHATIQIHTCMFVCMFFAILLVYIWEFTTWFWVMLQCRIKHIIWIPFSTRELLPLTVKLLLSVIFNQKWSSGVSPHMVPVFAFV